MSIPHGLSKEGIAKDWKSYIKLAGTKENTVYIMFRLTNLVILFAVVVCAMALPADPVKPPSGATGLSSKQPIPVSGEKGVSDKSDLATDAQTYWSYRYINEVPKLHYNVPALGIRTYAWAPYHWYYGASAPVIIDE